MDTMALSLPEKVLLDLKELAAQAETEPWKLVALWVEAARQHHLWQSDLKTIRDEIERDGILLAGLTEEETLNRLRETRREIFEAEYAHLYR
jgi:hypothetical protein